MTPVQGEPPKLDMKLPRKLKRFLNGLRQFAIETQPINGPGIVLDQTPRGRILRAGQTGQEVLFYVVQNGTLTAYMIPATVNPNAPGLA